MSVLHRFRAPRNQVYNQVVIKYIIKSIYQEKKLLNLSGVLIDSLIKHNILFNLHKVSICQARSHLSMSKFSPLAQKKRNNTSFKVYRYQVSYQVYYQVYLSRELFTNRTAKNRINTGFLID